MGIVDTLFTLYFINQKLWDQGWASTSKSKPKPAEKDKKPKPQGPRPPQRARSYSPIPLRRSRRRPASSISSDDDDEERIPHRRQRGAVRQSRANGYSPSPPPRPRARPRSALRGSRESSMESMEASGSHVPRRPDQEVRFQGPDGRFVIPGESSPEMVRSDTEDTIIPSTTNGVVLTGDGTRVVDLDEMRISVPRATEPGVWVSHSTVPSLQRTRVFEFRDCTPDPAGATIIDFERSIVERGRSRERGRLHQRWEIEGPLQLEDGDIAVRASWSL